MRRWMSLVVAGVALVAIAGGVLMAQRGGRGRGQQYPPGECPAGMAEKRSADVLSPRERVSLNAKVFSTMNSRAPHGTGNAC